MDMRLRCCTCHTHYRTASVCPAHCTRRSWHHQCVYVAISTKTLYWTPAVFLVYLKIVCIVTCNYHWWGLLHGSRNVWFPTINCCWCEWKTRNNCNTYFLSRILIISLWPFSAARWRGVFSFLSLTLTPAGEEAFQLVVHISAARAGYPAHCRPSSFSACVIILLQLCIKLH